VVSLDERNGYKRVWWPRSIDSRSGPLIERNYLQLNSIAAGATLGASHFSASTDAAPPRRPGHRNFAVDGRGVIFSGRTREPIAHGLTRPHSARLHRGRLWVDNSGYGELGIVSRGRFDPVARLPGWTRGLCFHGDFAFVGTSRVIPEFRQYAPGLDLRASVCGVHAVDARSGRILGSFVWPRGNQIFAVDWLEGALDLPLSPEALRRERGPVVLCFSSSRPAQMTEPFRLSCSRPCTKTGNTTHRFLDGHLQMLVYPFESQLGTRLVNDALASTFPVKYSWPEFRLDASASADYLSIIDEETRVRARTPQVSKFRHVPFDFSDEERGVIYTKLVGATGRSRATTWPPSFERRLRPGRITRRAGGKQSTWATADHRRRRGEDPRRPARGARAPRRP
jgi:hypothetical protein